MVHVPYRGSYFPDLLGGQVQVVFCPVPSSIGYIKADKLRALAVTTAARWQGLPDMPSVAEFLPGYDVSLWFGIGAPKDTPTGIIDRLNKEINAGLSDSKLNAQLADLGEVLVPDDACRIRETYRRRDREVGQGDPRGQHQAGVRPRPRRRIFHSFRSTSVLREPWTLSARWKDSLHAKASFSVKSFLRQESCRG